MYKRILLKLSGERLQGSSGFGMCSESIKNIALIVKGIVNEGFQLSIVIGGGNLFRGKDLKNLNLPRTPADQIGMLATIMNGLVLENALKDEGIETSLFSALECPKVCHSYQWGECLKALQQNHVLIFVGGTGNPYFTTDTAAAMRAIEIGADLLLKATKVDGVYESDPKHDPQAKRFSKISYDDYLKKDLKVMDATSVALCRDQKMPVFIFNMDSLGKKPLSEILASPEMGTVMHST